VTLSVPFDPEFLKECRWIVRRDGGTLAELVQTSLSWFVRECCYPELTIPPPRDIPPVSRTIQ